MKVLTFSMILFSGLVFSQQEPLHKFRERLNDSLKIQKADPKLFEQLKSQANSVRSDSGTLYKILNKKTENPEQYTMLIKKPDTDKIISIPNKFPDNNAVAAETKIREKIFKK